MNQLEFIKDHPLYKEVMEMSNIYGIPVEIKIGDEDMFNLGETVGNSRYISITINPSASEDLAVFIHELLHAKIKLMFYPMASFYNQITLPEIISNTISSLTNSIQHSYIFREMKKIGVSQKHIDDQFAEHILRKGREDRTETVEMAHAANYLEFSLRFPNNIDILSQDPVISRTEGYSLYLKFREALPKVVSPEEFRKAYVLVIKILDDYLLEKIGARMWLDHFVCVDPVYIEEKNTIASKQFIISKEITTQPHHFILDKYDGQCSFFFDKAISDDLLQNYLDTLTVRDMMKFI